MEPSLPAVFAQKRYVGGYDRTMKVGNQMGAGDFVYGAGWLSPLNLRVFQMFGATTPVYSTLIVIEMLK